MNKIAYNHWIDLLRKRKKEILTKDNEFPDFIYQPQLDDMKHAVEFLVSNFTPKQATIFLLKEAFHYQLNEIADLFDSTEMAIKANLHRARKRLEKEEGQTSSIALFWDEEERALLSEVFYEALKNQDPTVVIESISTINKVHLEPRLISGKSCSVSSFSPSSTLCMAA